MFSKIAFFKKNIFKIISIFFCIFLILFFCINLFLRYQNKVSLEKDVLHIKSLNKDNIFSIDSITIFSSVNANNNADSKDYWNLNLYQYSDIAIKINNKNKEQSLSSLNTVKELYIKDINIIKEPILGDPIFMCKYYLDFGKPIIENRNIINNDFYFNIINKQNVNYSDKDYYYDCSLPIIIQYKNDNIRTNFRISNNEGPIFYDGRLLEKSKTSIESLLCSISIDLYITNQLDQVFFCRVYIDIPLKEDDVTIYSQNIINKINCNYKFYRTK